MTESESSSLALALKNIIIKSHTNDNIFINNVSCYVKKGGITAVLGPSGSGKSLLLQAISARVQDLEINGEVFMNGESTRTLSV